VVTRAILPALGGCQAGESPSRPAPAGLSDATEQPVRLRIAQLYHRIAHAQLLADQRLVVRHRLGAQVQPLGDHIERIAGQQTLRHLELAL